MNKYLFKIPASYWINQAVGYFFFIFALFCVPLNEIREYSQITIFTEIVSEWVPMLSEINKVAGFSRDLVFYYSMMWVATPVFALGLIGFGVFHPNIKTTVTQRISAPLLPILAGLTFWIICLLIALCWPMDHESYSWRDQMLFRNALGFSLFGLMTMWVWSLLFGYIYMLIEKFVLKISNSISRG